MKVITKHYSGEQDGYLYPRAQEIGGVSGDSDACKIYFKLPKQFEIGWGKMIAFDGELYDPITKQYIPMEYPLASDNSFTIPSEITDQYRGKTINYHLVLNEIGTSTVILSQPSTLYFSKTAKNANVVTYLATHAFVDADYGIDETKDRPYLRFFRMETNPDVKLTMDVPYLDSDGKIPRQFIDVDKYSVNVFDVANQDQLVTLKDALVGDWGRIVANGPFKGQMFMLTGEYDVLDNWVLIYTDTPLFTDVKTNGLTVLTGANLDYIKGKALYTDADGDVLGSDTTPDELKQLHGIKTDKTVQQQIDNKIELVDEATETGGKACFAPFGMTPDFSNPELVTVKVDKVRLSKNPSSTYSRVDSIDIPIPRAYVEKDNPITGTNTAGLYTKGLADKKADAKTTIANGVSEISNKPGDGGACLTFTNINGIKSGIGVHDGSGNGISAQIYAVNKDDYTDGVKLNIEKDRITYTKNKATTARTEKDELAVKADVEQSIKDLLYVKSITPKTDSDGVKGITIKHSEASAIADFDYGMTKLEALPEFKPGIPYNFTYFYEQIPSVNKITVKAHTITLDNKKKHDSFTMDVVAMNGTNAGLYTKVLADKKVDVFQGTGYAEKGIIVGADGYIKPGEFKLRDACELQKITTTSSRTPGDSTVYTAGKSDITFIKLLGNEDVSGEPYHIPFNINSIVQEATQISTTFDTITLDNAKTKKSYPIIIPSADIANNKAGLYTKAMAVAKLDVEKTDGSFTSEITNNGNNIAGIITESGADRSQVIQNANDFSAYITDGTDKAELIITKDSAYLQKGSEAGVTIQPGQEIVRKDALDLKVDRTVKDAQNAHDTIDNSYSQNGCVMQTQLDDADRTIVSFNTASENGATGILAQIYAKRTTGADAGKGMRLNFTRDGAYYGVGDATPPDADHEIATIGGTVKVGNELTTGEIDTLIGVW